VVRAWAQSRPHGITINSPGLWHFTAYPDEVYPHFQKYLAVNQSLSPIDAVDLGASIAETYGKAIGPVQRKLCMTHLVLLSYFIDHAVASLASLSKHKPDRAKVVISQIASKAYFVGEIAGLRLAGRGG
jgi:phosphatidylinositol 4-kinase A